MERDLLHPAHEEEKQKHKLKRLIQAPNSYFMDVKCGGCNQTSTIFSHAQTVVACDNCKNILCKPTGGKCKLTLGSAFKVKGA
jgi:small subunit ribosomal protein S27e